MTSTIIRMPHRWLLDANTFKRVIQTSKFVTSTLGWNVLMITRSLKCPMTSKYSRGLKGKSTRRSVILLEVEYATFFCDVVDRPGIERLLISRLPHTQTHCVWVSSVIRWLPTFLSCPRISMLRMRVWMRNWMASFRAAISVNAIATSTQLYSLLFNTNSDSKPSSYLDAQ